MPNPKKVKLQPKHRALVYGQKVVPSLYLSGVWLEALGFKVGDRVSITPRELLLIIEPLQVAEAEPDYRAELKQVKQTLKKLVK